MNQYEQEEEPVYRCKNCGQLYPESTVATRPVSKEKYCNICQGEVRLCTEQDLN